MASNRPSSAVIVLGVVLALGVSAGVVLVAGPAKTVRALLAVDSVELVAIISLSLVWLSAWSAAFYTVFGIVDVPRSIANTFVVYAGVTFVNSVTPFAQLGGEALAGWVVSRNTEADYETSLTAVASVDGRVTTR